MRVTLVRVEAGWLAFCAFGWLIVSLSEAQSEAECRASGGFLCFSTGDVFLLVGMFAAGTFAVGAVAIALIWTVVAWARRR